MNPASGTCCPGDSIQLTCNGSGTFVWQGQSGTIGGNSSVVYVKTQGSYYCVRTDAGGCTLVSNTAEVNQYATPYLAVTPSTVLCAGDSVVISVITSVGAAIQWQAPFSGSGTQKKVTSPGTYLFGYILRYSNLCKYYYYPINPNCAYKCKRAFDFLQGRFSCTFC